MSTVAGVPLRAALVDLGRAKASGQLMLADQSGHQARIHFREGFVIGIQMPDHRPRIGMRLVAAGMISPDQLATALHLQQSEAAANRNGVPVRIGDVLVRIGAVGRGVVEQIAQAQLADNLAGLMTWHVRDTGFEPADPTVGQPAGDTPVEIDRLLVAADARRPILIELVRRLGGPAAVPDLAGIPTVDPHPTLGPHDWALLCKIDGQRQLGELAAACGYTTLEAAQILDGLLSVGLITIGRADVGNRDQEEVDTAALLRELSGIAGGPAGVSRRRPSGAGGQPSGPNRPPTKKRGGLFSR